MLAYTISGVFSRFVWRLVKLRGTHECESYPAASLPAVIDTWEKSYLNLKGMRCYCGHSKAPHAIAVAIGDTAAFIAWLHAKRGRLQGRENTGQDPALNCLFLLSSAKREKRPLQGQTATAKLRTKTHSPVLSASIHTQKPQLLAPCSCCWGSEESQGKKSTSGVLTAQAGLGLGWQPLEWEPLKWSCSVIQGSANPQGSKFQVLNCTCCPGELTRQCSSTSALSGSHNAVFSPVPNQS